jgi:hypothetical protein
LSARNACGSWVAASLTALVIACSGSVHSRDATVDAGRHVAEPDGGRDGGREGSIEGGRARDSGDANICAPAVPWLGSSALGCVDGGKVCTCWGGEQRSLARRVGSLTAADTGIYFLDIASQFFGPSPFGGVSYATLVRLSSCGAVPTQISIGEAVEQVVVTGTALFWISSPSTSLHPTLNRASLDGCGLKVLSDSKVDLGPVTADATRIYWFHNDNVPYGTEPLCATGLRFRYRIFSMPLGSTDVTSDATLLFQVETPCPSPDAAVPPASTLMNAVTLRSDGHDLYWRTRDGMLATMPVTGGEPVVLGSGLGSSDTLAVGSSSVVAGGPNGLFRIPKRGGNADLLAAGAVPLGAVALDSGDDVYFIDAASGTLGRIALAGGAVAPLLSFAPVDPGVSVPVAVDAQSVYVVTPDGPLRVLAMPK